MRQVGAPARGPRRRLAGFRLRSGPGLQLQPAVMDGASRAGEAYRQIIRRMVDPTSAPVSMPTAEGWVDRLRRMFLVNVGSSGAH